TGRFLCTPGARSRNRPATSRSCPVLKLGPRTTNNGPSLSRPIRSEWRGSSMPMNMPSIAALSRTRNAMAVWPRKRDFKVGGVKESPCKKPLIARGKFPLHGVDLLISDDPPPPPGCRGEVPPHSPPQHLAELG